MGRQKSLGPQVAVRVSLEAHETLSQRAKEAGLSLGLLMRRELEGLVDGNGRTPTGMVNNCPHKRTRLHANGITTCWECGWRRDVDGWRP